MKNMKKTKEKKSRSEISAANSANETFGGNLYGIEGWGAQDAEPGRQIFKTDSPLLKYWIQQ